MPKATPAPTELALEYHPLETLQRWPRNPKGHDIPELERSMARFGFTSPLVVDETTGRLVAGHGRLETLQALKDGRQAPPRGILERDGAWLVPVVRGVAFANEAEADAYVIGDNALTILGGWIEDQLAQNLQRVHDHTGDLAGTGFTVEHLDRLLAKGHPETPTDPPTPHPDRLPELVAKWGVAPGDVWRIGPHRLACGDSTDPATMERVLAGAKPTVMWSDPPYGVAFRSNARTATKKFDHIAGDDRPLVEYLPLAVGIPVWYVCTRWDVAPTWLDAIAANGYTTRSWIVWAKGRGGMGDLVGAYAPTHEAILRAEPPTTPKRGKGKDADPTHDTVLFATKGRVPFAHGGRDADVWTHAPDPGTTYLHPTQKPVALPARAMRNHSKAGDTILDPFAGSGASILAAHQLDRRAAAIELDPRYVAATLERMTALDPELEPTKETRP